MLTFFIILGAAIVIVGFFLGNVYNKLVALRERVRNAFAQIDVQLERRHDLIPNLLETVKGYLRHERATLEDAPQPLHDWTQRIDPSTLAEAVVRKMCLSFVRVTRPLAGYDLGSPKPMPVLAPVMKNVSPV